MGVDDPPDEIWGKRQPVDLYIAWQKGIGLLTAGIAIVFGSTGRNTYREQVELHYS